jgi:hypothetical protein
MAEIPAFLIFIFLEVEIIELLSCLRTLVTLSFGTPGTLDEHISTVQFLDAANVDWAIVVTTPQQVSLIDVKK